jgi:allantoate deiminase
MPSFDAADTVMQRIASLGRISDDPACLTRTFGSAAMTRANDQVVLWMEEAGMAVRRDAIGNLIGHYPAAAADAKILLLGSHLDTVRNAGQFDGPLGVLVAIAAVQHCHNRNVRLPFAIEVIGFGDEEGTRFQSAYLGSKVVAGRFNNADLERTDASGITLADAICAFGCDPNKLHSARMDPDRLLGYFEVHIEQGPVLEKNDLSVGVVTAIAGQTRARLTFRGMAGHAGTVPMALRHDALCAGGEFILSAETEARSIAGLVATVGQITALPGASNVIPSEVVLSLDVRHAEDLKRTSACSNLRSLADQIAEKRGVSVNWELIQETSSVTCDPGFVSKLQQIVARHQAKSISLASGAGHDAVPLSEITPVGMLFVRCKGGISHHPDESATVEDIRVAIAVLIDFIEQFTA